MKMLVLWGVMLAVSVRAYPNGPPMESCQSMFPTGHKVNAMTSDPPYALEVTGGPINETSKNLTVTLRVKNNTEYKYFEGMFVQARMASCYNDKPVGQFSIKERHDFLQIMDCDKDRPRSAIAHKKTEHINDAIEFVWTSPRSEPGHIYFRATVVKNTTTFWTNVVSDIIPDITDKMKVDDKPMCFICTQMTCTASSSAAMTSLLVAALTFWLACQ